MNFMTEFHDFSIQFFPYHENMNFINFLYENYEFHTQFKGFQPYNKY